MKRGGKCEGGPCFHGPGGAQQRKRGKFLLPAQPNRTCVLSSQEAGTGPDRFKKGALLIYGHAAHTVIDCGVNPVSTGGCLNAAQSADGAYRQQVYPQAFPMFSYRGTPAAQRKYHISYIKENLID